MRILFYFLLALAVPAMAAEPQPQTLSLVLERVSRSPSPVVVLDLDDTLIRTRDRTARILHELAESPAFAAQFPSVAVSLANLPAEQVRYRMADTFAALGVRDEAAIAAATAFWTPRFFSSAYCARDPETPGAARFLNELIKKGARIVYLTGRDQPNMGSGTLESLQSLGFPSPPSSFLLMKPRFEQDDLAFKKESIEKIRTFGEVVAVFENEPANLNLLHSSFEGSMAVFLDTIHSPRPDLPSPNAYWIKDFRH